jgi:hypothetical protein
LYRLYNHLSCNPHDDFLMPVGSEAGSPEPLLRPSPATVERPGTRLRGLCRGHAGEVVGTILGNSSIDALKGSGQSDARKVRAMRTRPKWVGILVMLAVLLCLSTLPGYADRGGHGSRGHGFKGHGHRGHGSHHSFHHGFRGPRVRVGIGLGTVWGPYWDGGPYWPYDADPPVVVAPPPVVVQPSPHYWYYCDSAQAYYPYVQHCPTGWRPVTPTPP